MLIPDTNKAAITKLENSLSDYYRNVKDYPAHHEASHHPELWEVVFSLAAGTMKERGNCRILEIGAGRSGFGQALRSQFPDGVHLTSQDVTNINVEFLSQHSDKVEIGDVMELRGRYDLIFHSYVYEHLCRPRQFLNHAWQLLSESGHHVILSPHYSVPFYLQPAFDHLNATDRLLVALKLAWTDARALATGRPAFLLMGDPAVFHMPFESDRDAIHRVRYYDLLYEIGAKAEIRWFKLKSYGIKDWLIKTFFTLRVTLHKR